MKIFILILFIVNILKSQTPVNSSKFPMISSDQKTITATTSFFDPKQEENVILRRERRRGQIDSIQEVINKMNNSLGLLKSKIKNRVNQMNDIIDSSLAYKEKHNLTVSNLNLNQFRKLIKFISMQNKLTKNGSSFSLQKISSDIDLRKLEDQEKAKLKHVFRIRRVNSQQEVVKFKFFQPISHFKELGAGIYYYFYFLKFFMLLFFFISLLSIISIGITMTGNGLQQYKEEGFFLKTTISNSHTTVLSEAEMKQIQNFDSQQKDSFFQEKNAKNSLQFYINMSIDFIISMMFLIAIYTFQIISVKRIKSIDLKRPSARHYAIKVDKLPKNNITQAELTEFFSQFSEVKNVAFSYKFNQHFQTLIEINQIKEKIKNFLKKDQNKLSKKYIKQRQDLYEQLKLQVLKIYKTEQQKFDLTNFKNFDIISAYVIFNESNKPNQIYDDFKNAYRNSFFQKLLCKKKIIDKKYLFREQYKIKISQPDHPGNLHWENMQYTQSFRRKRLILLYLVIFFIIVLSFTINLFLTAFTNNYEGQKCEGTFNRQDIDTSDQSPQMGEYIYCYCSQFPFYYLFKKQHESFNVCEQEYMYQLQQVIIVIAIAFAISLVNILIESVIFRMVKYIKYSTLTMSVIKQINLTLIAEYCNTAFVLMLIYKKTFNLDLPQLFNKITNSNFFQLNQTEEFDRHWYILVAKKLFIPLLLLCFNPHSSEWFLCYFKSFLAKIRLKFIKSKRKFIEVYQLPTFDLGYRFKNVLKLVIVCFTFSSGIPLFNIFIFAGLLFTFISHKIILINYSGRVPPYSVDIIKSIFKILKISLLIHLIFSMMLFSDYEIYPSQNEFFVEIGIAQDTQNQFITYILYKIYQVFPIFCLFVLTLLCIFFEVFVVGLLQKIIDYFSKKKIQHVELEQTYDQVRKQLKSTSIQDYQILSNPIYNSILNFKKSDLQVLKSMVINKSLGQIIKLNSQSYQNLEKVTSLEGEGIQNQLKQNFCEDQEKIIIEEKQENNDKSLENIQNKQNIQQELKADENNQNEIEQEADEKLNEIQVEEKSKEFEIVEDKKEEQKEKESQKQDEENKC